MVHTSGSNQSWSAPAARPFVISCQVPPASGDLVTPPSEVEKKRVEPEAKLGARATLLTLVTAVKPLVSCCQELPPSTERRMPPLPAPANRVESDA